MLFQTLSTYRQARERGRERRVYEIFSPLLKYILTYFETNIGFIVNEFGHVHDYG